MTADLREMLIAAMAAEDWWRVWDIAHRVEGGRWRPGRHGVATPLADAAEAHLDEHPVSAAGRTAIECAFTAALEELNHAIAAEATR